MFWPDNDITSYTQTTFYAYNGSPTATPAKIVRIGWTYYITQLPSAANFSYTQPIVKPPKNWRWFNALRPPALFVAMVAPCALLAARTWRASRLLDRGNAARSKRRRWQHATLAT